MKYISYKNIVIIKKLSSRMQQEEGRERRKTRPASRRGLVRSRLRGPRKGETAQLGRGRGIDSLSPGEHLQTVQHLCDPWQGDFSPDVSRGLQREPP